MVARWLPLQFGELDDAQTPRTDAIVPLFRSAGLPARVRMHMEACQKTPIAGLPAFAGAV